MTVPEFTVPRAFAVASKQVIFERKFMHPLSELNLFGNLGRPIRKPESSKWLFSKWKGI